MQHNFKTDKKTLRGATCTPEITVLLHIKLYTCMKDLSYYLLIFSLFIFFLQNYINEQVTVI